MRIGLYRHRITFQNPVYSQDSNGDRSTTWSDWATVWAAIEPNTGKTYYEAAQAESKAEGRMRIRYKKGINSNMRVKFGNRYFNIISVINPREDKKETHVYYMEKL
jgi:SPP1 family predicted phage head-tail adaptor